MPLPAEIPNKFGARETYTPLAAEISWQIDGHALESSENGEIG
jgi:hypothetical protein